jgi:hypothetical protein
VTRGGERRRSRRDDVGAYLVLYALLGVAFFTMAGIVLDIAAFRQGRRSDRAAADLAATAGAGSIDVDDGGSYAAACDMAWGYILANRSESGGTISPPDCSGTFPSGTLCDSFTPERTTTGTVNGATITITSPVLDSSPLMEAELEKGDQPQAVNAAKDGTPCQRVGVRIVRTRTFLFGQVAGVTGATTDVHSVARTLTGTSTTEVPGIVALERTGCNVIGTGGAGGTLSVAGIGQGGFIQVDSDGSGCGSGGFTIDPADTDTIEALPDGAAQGVIASVAAGGANFARAFDPADVAAGRLDPTPTPAPSRTGRAMIDSRYATAISNFAAQFASGPPAGYTLYSGPCSIPADPVPIVISGNTYVDCPIFEVFGNVTFTGPVVGFSGGLFVRNGGCVAVNDASCGAAGATATDSALFIGDAVAKEPTGRLVLNRTYVQATNAIDIPVDPDPAPDSELTWTAPLGSAFEDLLADVESAGIVRLAEQDTTVLEGTVFAPNGTLVLEARNGAGIDVALQGVAKDVRLLGNGRVALSPVAGRATGRLTRQVRLIR